MTLAPGSRLGPYEIVAPLGAGGMGEVYKAVDTRLDRTVAIKILPADVAADPLRQERLQREARAISSLTHAHICTLHDIGAQDGVEFLVMEYLAGETLAHRLLRGALPLEEVLRIAVQLADALEAAHRTGLTHRDLKPANVMLTQGGAKVLDFGLAKWHGRPPDVVSSVANATVHSTLTQTGIVVGTIQYMAPEQVEGKAADSRADLFSLGAIVYEMTTGQRAFAGTSSASVMAAILTSAPAPMTIAQPVTPPALERVVTKCLAKEASRRWQTAADLRDALAWVAEDLAAPATAAAPIPRRPFWMLIALGVAGALALAVLVTTSLRRVPSDAQPTRLILTPPENVSFGSVPGDVGAAIALSPDGRQLAFTASTNVGKSGVWVRALDGLTVRQLPGTDGASPNSPPFWSPDSRAIGFFADGSLKSVDVSGGVLRVVCTAPDGRGGAWNSAGEIIFPLTATSGLYRVPASGGTPVQLTNLDHQSSHRWPVFLPDGRHFLYLAETHEKIPDPEAHRGLFVGSLDLAPPKQLLNSDSMFSNVAYAQPGYVLYVREGSLLAQPFDASRLELTGPAVTVAPQVAYAMGRAYANFSASSNGVLAYGSASSVDTQLHWYDRAGRVLGRIGAGGQQSEPALSPDGVHVAIARMDASVRTNDIWVVDTRNGAASRFTSFRADEVGPVWSPDGRQLMWSSSWSINRVGLFRKASDGTGDAERLLGNSNYGSPYADDWTRDGRFVVYDDGTPTTKTDLWALPLFGDHKPVLLVRTDGDDMQGQVSPDGRWLAYTSNTSSGRPEVYVQPFVARPDAEAPAAPAITAPRVWGIETDTGAAGGRWQVSTSGGVQPRWAHGGRELFYIAADKTLMSAKVRPNRTKFDVDPPRALFTVAIRQFDGPWAYAVAPDNKRFLVDVAVSEPDRSLVVVLNWQEELKQRVPTR